MTDLFASPGMTASTIVILIIEGLSLLMLFLNIQIFRSQSEKYRLLLANLGNQSAWGWPGKILIPLYIVLTLGTTAVTILIFIFQPHIL